MKLVAVIVLVTLFVASQAFNDNFRRLALFNTMSGRSPFDFSSMFGRRRVATNTSGGSGLGKMSMLFMLGEGDGFFGM